MENEFVIKHTKWFEDDYKPKILFHDEEENYSMIWGKYDGSFALGVRWHKGGVNGKGFPSQGSIPTWYVEPNFLIVPILKEILSKSIVQGKSTYIKNISLALEKMESQK